MYFIFKIIIFNILIKFYFLKKLKNKKKNFNLLNNIIFIIKYIILLKVKKKLKFLLQDKKYNFFFTFNKIIYLFTKYKNGCMLMQEQERIRN